MYARARRGGRARAHVVGVAIVVIVVVVVVGVAIDVVIGVVIRAAWDQKWSGLQRRTPHKAAGHEAANSGAMSDGWLPPEERARHRDSIT